MNLSTSFLLIVVFVVIYVILINIYSVLFRLTGMTKEKSIFQSISLLTNCGYTTGESEIVVNDKTRRRIALGAMLTGYTFSVVIVSLLINVFLNMNMQDLQDSFTFIVICLGILFAFLILIKIPIIGKFLDSVLKSIAMGFFKKKKNDNIITVLDNYGKDAVVEIYINKMPQILRGKTLLESRIKDTHKLNFLDFSRKGRSHEVNKDTIFQKGDLIVLFGNIDNIKDVFLTHRRTSELNENDNTKKGMVIQNTLDIIENYGKDILAEIDINCLPDFLDNKTLVESRIKDIYKINVMMVKRDGSPIEINKDTIINQFDKVIVFGSYINVRAAFNISE